MKSKQSTHVILFCHGSSNPLWAAPFRELTTELQAKYGANQVHLGFLELSEPNLETLVRKIAQSGPGHVKVLPVFLSAGKHLREDVPPLLVKFGEEYQDLTFELLEPVGRQPAFITMLDGLVGENLKD